MIRKVDIFSFHEFSLLVAFQVMYECELFQVFELMAK